MLEEVGKTASEVPWLALLLGLIGDVAEAIEAEEEWRLAAL